jgi:hypothetical protein
MRFTGEGAVALFAGVPPACEDRAQRAFHAALADGYSVSQVDTDRLRAAVEKNGAGLR